MSINGITCKNGSSLGLSAPVPGDGSILNIYNTGGYTAQIDGSLTIGNGINLGNLIVKGTATIGNLAFTDLTVSGTLTAGNANITGTVLDIIGTTFLNGTSYIYDHNLVVQGAGIVIQPSLTPQAASGLYIQTPAGTNQVYIDATTGTIGCKGVYVQNPAGTTMASIDNAGTLTANCPVIAIYQSLPTPSSTGFIITQTITPPTTGTYLINVYIYFINNVDNNNLGGWYSGISASSNAYTLPLYKYGASYSNNIIYYSGISPEYGSVCSYSSCIRLTVGTQYYILVSMSTNTIINFYGGSITSSYVRIC